MASRVLVVGSGCIGLRTALELTRKRVSVVLRSPVHPLDKSNCSQGAGGLWMPIYCEDPRVDQWGFETLDEIYPLAEDAENSLVDLRHVLALKKRHEGPSTEDMVADNYHKGTGGRSLLPSWSSDARFKFQNVTLEQVQWQNQIHKLRLPSLAKAQEAGYNHAWFFQTPVVDCPKMMEHFLDELTGSNISKSAGKADINVETGIYYQSKAELFEEAKNFGCDAIVNCTGMGASELCKDVELVGARGILMNYDRESCKRLEHKDDDGTISAGVNDQLHDACIFADEAPWGTPEYPSYMIVRGDDIVVGGTCVKGDTETKIRPQERTRLFETARLLGIDTNACQPKEEWVGFRPYRQEIRCEIDDEKSMSNDTENDDRIRLVHCYGTGGSGWTIYTGLAKEAARLAMQ
ncbi:unnamed protein product [Pseudo-nitzschia multistriata]|uniref:FAD dependent oxidoreductase domain-containing protein n=1 Tax=Pseudo-nitzschia multistriata TaxID=183589 RepID=A0A448Z2H4_9STRA|nr:unnamed protein product [Pseudo-nitzschia multistriata]